MVAQILVIITLCIIAGIFDTKHEDTLILKGKCKRSHLMGLGRDATTIALGVFIGIGW